jgi:hypothetical protein
MAATITGLANSLIQAINNSSLFGNFKTGYLANVVSNGSANAVTLAIAIAATIENSRYFEEINSSWCASVTTANTAAQMQASMISMIARSRHFENLKASYISGSN